MAMENEPKKKNIIKSIILGFFAILGVLFIVILFMPDDEEGEASKAAVRESVTEAEEKKEPKEAKEAEAVKESGAETKPENGQNTGSAGVAALSVGTGAKSATVMIYMNGSDLESKSGEATRDISEMIASGIGEKANVVIQTMGTKKWHDYGISSKTAQTWQIKDGSLKLVRDDLGQLDCTEEKTLSEFIDYGKKNYPADRYIFIFWDHGAGPVYGFGYDEWQAEEKSLSLADISKAFSDNSDIHFDIIGMDCCIMANLETCCVLAPYCKYALLSEDFESGLGWSYEKWMKHLEQDTGISTPILGKFIVDEIIKDNESSYEGDSVSIGLFNVSTADSLFNAWKTYAYKNEKALLDTNYSRLHMSKGRGTKGFLDIWSSDQSNVTLADYYISDVLALTESIDNKSDEARSLISALKAAVVSYGHSREKNELTGLSVSLPYGDRYFYEELKKVYGQLDFDKDYIEWLGQFSANSQSSFFDFSNFENSWGGWSGYENEYGCNLINGACEYSYDYGSDNGNYDEYYETGDDWLYDYEEDIWYQYDGDNLYLYDEESGIELYYDEQNDEMYYYDEEDDDWYLYEE